MCPPGLACLDDRRTRLHQWGPLPFPDWKVIFGSYTKEDKGFPARLFPFSCRP